jgi:hypothetical protein
MASLLLLALNDSRSVQQMTRADALARRGTKPTT